MTILALSLSLPAQAAPPASKTLQEAKQVLDELQEVPNKGLPKALLNNAEAVVIIPNTVKAGFVVGGRVGHGVAILKDDKKAWGDVRFVSLGGASVGFQAGVQVSDVVLVFKNRKGLDRIMDGKAKLTLGADAAVSAGPVGRDARVATDALLKSEIWSYSRSRGLFAGVALDGAILAADNDTTNDYYKDSKEETRKAGDALKLKIASMVVDGVPELPQATLPGPGSVPAPIPGDLPPPPAQNLQIPPTVGPYVPPPSNMRQPVFPLLRKVFGRGKE
jgi:lipid-binding SYLF domain-containing protein